MKEIIQPYRHLASAIIELAIEDYKALVKRGYCLGLKQIKKTGSCGLIVGGSRFRNAEIEQLLAYINGPSLAESLALGCLNVTEQSIREGLRVLTPENVRLKATT